jgi:NADH:ubiquinone oxidoreductase subunit F (NADH-binding)/(2Fe-2S) ferredoxin/NAD-dependent dihydropyrimidine dehydrogenase PreA subunit
LPSGNVDPRVLTIESLTAMAGPAVVSPDTQRSALRSGFETADDALTGRRIAGGILVVVSVGSCALARGAAQVADAVEEELLRLDLAGSVEVRRTGCHGFCEIEPIVAIYPRGLMYQGVCPADVPEIISRSVVNHEVVDRLLFADPSTGQKCAAEPDLPFYRKQRRLLLGRNSFVDPCRIEDYVAGGGYFALASALFEMTPDDVVHEIGRSRLRSRTGRGIAVDRKWQACRSQPPSDGVRRVICSADGGGTEAYVARALLEGNPHSIIEGMIIGAYAVGACLGHIHVRDGHSLAARNLSVALEQARAWGCLGKDVLGSGFCFDIGVVSGRSAPVCDHPQTLSPRFHCRPGSLWLTYGDAGMQALYSCPLAVDDLETWANVPLIIGRGAEWYSGIGTTRSRGTKLFSLVGMTRNTGLVEVPMGTSLAEIVHGIGGGTRTGGEIKAVHIGGPTGSFIPARLMDMKVDFDSLTHAGAPMGASITVLDEHNCMVDLARYFTGFLVRELCGKCSGCGQGLDKMLHILDDLAEGRGLEGDIALLEGLATSIMDASHCPQGAGASNPVLSGIRYFADEYRAHAADRRCPAGVCKPLVTVSIDPDKCNGCHACAAECDQGAIVGRASGPHSIDQGKCVRCRVCLDSCPSGAIHIS